MDKASHKITHDVAYFVLFEQAWLRWSITSEATPQSMAFSDELIKISDVTVLKKEIKIDLGLERLVENHNVWVNSKDQAMTRLLAFLAPCSFLYGWCGLWATFLHSGVRSTTVAAGTGIFSVTRHDVGLRLVLAHAWLTDGLLIQ